MFDMRNRQSGCGYAEKVIEFVYKEMDAAERSGFESHLETCASCAKEISAFSSVTEAIGDWKQSAFDVLETPSFVNPAAEVTAQAPIAAGSAIPISERIRGLIGSYSLLWQTASALGAILLTIGLLWILIGSEDTDKNKAAADIPQKSSSQKPSAEENLLVADGKDAEEDIETSVPIDSKENSESGITSGSDVNQLAAKKKPAKNLRGDTKARTVKTAAPSPPVKRKYQNKPLKQRPNQLDKPAPALETLTELASVDEAEDESLRLTELFSISDSDER